jgi:hypothetical protein
MPVTVTIKSLLMVICSATIHKEHTIPYPRQKFAKIIVDIAYLVYCIQIQIISHSTACRVLYERQPELLTYNTPTFKYIYIVDNNTKSPYKTLTQ